jgi:hypothetical protein
MWLEHLEENNKEIRSGMHLQTKLGPQTDQSDGSWYSSSSLNQLIQ